MHTAAQKGVSKKSDTKQCVGNKKFIDLQIQYYFTLRITKKLACIFLEPKKELNCALTIFSCVITHGSHVTAEHLTL